MHRSAVAFGLLLVACALVPGAAAGQPAAKKPTPEIQRWLKDSPEQILSCLDRNGDGFLDPGEVPPFLRKGFAKADRDGNGKLDRNEIALVQQALRRYFAQGQAPPTTRSATVEKVVQRLLKMDANGDGKISRAEAKGALVNQFDRFDLNKDGYLDRSELRRLAQLMVALQAAKGPKAGTGQGAPAALDFDALDRNADGRLTRDEVRGTPLEPLFDQIDTNHDGRIDPREFEAYLKQQQAK